MGVYDQLSQLNKDKEATVPQDTSVTSKHTQQATAPRERSSDEARENIRERRRKKARELPARDEIQEFSFRLRDELKVKVQAEVPHQWQKDLEKIARELNVKRLELYRFILGEFLGKVKRKQTE